MTAGAAPALVCLHVDDVGMCRGANAAFLELSRAGRVDCGSVMVPCPAFAEMAEAAAAEPALDLGVHLTLTAEKATWRWRPVSGAGPASGLVDDDGFMPRTVAELRRRADPAAVADELAAQVEAALAAGIDVTHLDDHMGAVLAPEFVEIYAALARAFDLPLIYPRSMAAYGPIHNLEGPGDDGLHARIGRDLERDGFRLVDEIRETSWDLARPAAERHDALFEALGPGFTVLALHPNAPGEVEAIEPDTAAIRIAEYEMLAGPDGARRLEGLPDRRTGLRALREALRTRRGAPHQDRMRTQPQADAPTG